MKNFKNPSDAEVRRDFPGGFPGDTQNKFLASGRSPAENEAFDFVKKLASYRKGTPALHSGRLMQYTPVDNVYVYFRYDDQKTVMVVMNANEQNYSLKTSRFAERIGKSTQARNVLDGQIQAIAVEVPLAARTAYVFELIP